MKNTVVAMMIFLSLYTVILGAVVLARGNFIDGAVCIACGLYCVVRASGLISDQ
jgi:hypothetical protein